MAKKNDPLFLKLIDKDIKKLTYKIMKDMTRKSRGEIDKFYQDYSPSQYDRIFGLKDLFHIKYKKISDANYEITYIFEDEYVTNKDHHGNGVPGNDGYKWAFLDSFVYGYHGGLYAWGYKKKKHPRMYPSPWMNISKYAKEKYNAEIIE